MNKEKQSPKEKQGLKEKKTLKGEMFELMIEDMSFEGQGVGRIKTGGEGRELVVFVPEAVPGDNVRVRLSKVKKNYAFSELLEIVSESPDRNEEFQCYYTNSVNSSETKSCGAERQSCGGCPFAKISYEAQLRIKELQLRNKLEHLAGLNLDEIIIKPIIPAENIIRYRNKATMPISTGGLITKKGGIVEPVHEPRIGFRPAKSHEIMDCRDCLLQAETAMAAAEATRRYMLEDNIPSYDKRWDKGLMKGMTVKTAFGSGEVMVVYEINGKGIPNAAKLIEYLDDAVYEAGGSLESVVLQNGKKELTLAGKATITDAIELPICGEAEPDEESGGALHKLNFEISADSFYQVNPEQTLKLYAAVREYCTRISATSEGASGTADKKLSVLDLYCGIGTIGLCVADLAEQVHGVEIQKEAVMDANRNATINAIVNATYECGKAEELIPKWLEKNSADAAILDPPRAGCRPNLLEAIAEAHIPNVIYVSCDPATLARDIKLLGEKGYELIEITPIDMFPHTSKLETVSLLKKREEYQSRHNKPAMNERNMIS